MPAEQLRRLVLATKVRWASATASSEVTARQRFLYPERRETGTPAWGRQPFNELAMSGRSRTAIFRERRLPGCCIVRLTSDRASAR